ncbi:MAG: hypothetical protein A2782_03975 [Candidatus Blackburnbacteria bacterium RIFCSPHIGHO2_01_FULL_43_15b]|uniref:Uncharacterized protein n=1 Tax=Candidatus Blackburnbacteria bacterium RIFCSPHIGHO2_01_FULL_43_15b TaxID=1797513 RepID=A0A1G1UZK9_9BACT|nr:MAG: hypothetical protein A2782_03975 [Candidatus Blackburnbacteria bacterium RIFCSPHIGHO2_01_FULL_43_15b]
MEPSKVLLKVLSSICANLAAAWLIVMIATGNPVTLTLNMVGATVSVLLSVKLEEMSEQYGH